jgi:hypothetical protein
VQRRLRRPVQRPAQSLPPQRWHAAAPVDRAPPHSAVELSWARLSAELPAPGGRPPSLLLRIPLSALHRVWAALRPRPAPGSRVGAPSQERGRAALACTSRELGRLLTPCAEGGGGGVDTHRDDKRGGDGGDAEGGVIVGGGSRRPSSCAVLRAQLFDLWVAHFFRRREARAERARERRAAEKAAEREKQRAQRAAAAEAAAGGFLGAQGAGDLQLIDFDTMDPNTPAREGNRSAEDHVLSEAEYTDLRQFLSLQRLAQQQVGRAAGSGLAGGRRLRAEELELQRGRWQWRQAAVVAVRSGYSAEERRRWHGFSLSSRPWALAAGHSQSSAAVAASWASRSQRPAEVTRRFFSSAEHGRRYLGERVVLAPSQWWHALDVHAPMAVAAVRGEGVAREEALVQQLQRRLHGAKQDNIPSEALREYARLLLLGYVSQ